MDVRFCMQLAGSSASGMHRPDREGRSNIPRIIKSLGIVLLALLTFVPAASAQRRRGFGGFYGGGGFHIRVFVGGGFYGPGFWGPGGYGPYSYGGYNAAPVGEVQIKTMAKGNSVFVDGGFAGRTGELKNFHLQPGTHTVELRAPNGASLYHERINVLAGKTIKIHVDVPARP
jgi:hypothetical protein